MRARPIPPFRPGPSRYPRRSPGHHRLALIAIESPLLDIDDYTVSESTWASIDLLERAQQRTLDGGPVIDVVGTADSHAATHTRAHSYRRGRPRYSAVRTAKPDLCSGAVASRGLMRRRLSRARSSCVAINASSAQAENTTAVTGGRPPNVDTRGGSKTRLDDVAAFGQRRHTEAHQRLRRREDMHPTGLPARLLARGVEPPREFSQPVRQLSPSSVLPPRHRNKQLGAATSAVLVRTTASS